MPREFVKPVREPPPKPSPRAPRPAPPSRSIDPATKRRQKRAKALRRDLVALQEHHFTPDELKELGPVRDAAEASWHVVHRLERRRNYLERAAEDASPAFRRAVKAERDLLDADLEKSEKARHKAQAAYNREIRRIERAKREECVGCP